MQQTQTANFVVHSLAKFYLQDSSDWTRSGLTKEQEDQLIALLECFRYWLMADPWIFAYGDCKSALLKVIMSAIPHRQGASSLIGNATLVSRQSLAPAAEKEGKPKKEGKLHIGFGSSKRRTAKLVYQQGPNTVPDVVAPATKKGLSAQLQV